LNQSYILHLRLDTHNELNEHPIVFSSTFVLPTITETYKLQVNFIVTHNVTTSGIYDLQTEMQDPITHAMYVKTIGAGISTDVWNRIGIDLSATFDQVGSNYILRNIYTRSAVYRIPEDAILDGNQKVSLANHKVYPSEPAFYAESQITSSPIDIQVQAENVTVVHQIGDVSNPDISQNAAIYIDEFEIYRGAPIFTSVIGGSIVANPYH